jgi:HPt (histidine-containing phosphotransfer) domain-containing protein
MSGSHLVLDMEGAVERMGDREIYGEIARAFACSMEDALRDLARVLREGDMPAATRLAHSLKGNCAAVGAGELGLACFTLESRCREGEAAEARRLLEELRPKLLDLRAILSDL